MRGIFSPEKLKKGFPHTGLQVQEKAQMWGNHLFGIFSPEKLKKGDSPIGFRGPGRSSDAGDHLLFSALFSSFSTQVIPAHSGIFSPEKLKKGPHTGFQGSRKSPDAGGITFSPLSALESSKKVIPPHRLQENHLFGIFSFEKLKRVIPPHRTQMRGKHLFSIFSPEKLKKVIPPHRAPGVQGGGGITFSKFSALKSSKR